MKIFLKVFAWLGAILFLLLEILLFGTENAFVFSFIALVPMLIGGIMGKPKYLWITCIITGSLYILSLFYFYSYLPDRIEHGYVYEICRDLIFCLLPGLVVILEGIWLKRKDTNSNSSPLFDGTA